MKRRGKLAAYMLRGWGIVRDGNCPVGNCPLPARDGQKDERIDGQMHRKIIITKTHPFIYIENLT